MILQETHLEPTVVDGYISAACLIVRRPVHFRFDRLVFQVVPSHARREGREEDIGEARRENWRLECRFALLRSADLSRVHKTQLHAVVSRRPPELKRSLVVQQPNEYPNEGVQPATRVEGLHDADRAAVVECVEQKGTFVLTSFLTFEESLNQLCLTRVDQGPKERREWKERQQQDTDGKGDRRNGGLRGVGSES